MVGVNFSGVFVESFSWKIIVWIFTLSVNTTALMGHFWCGYIRGQKIDVDVDVGVDVDVDVDVDDDVDVDVDSLTLSEAKWQEA